MCSVLSPADMMRARISGYVTSGYNSDVIVVTLYITVIVSKLKLKEQHRGSV